MLLLRVFASSRELVSPENVTTRRTIPSIMTGMSRQLFGLWGIDLDENAFAMAVAGAALKRVRDGIAELAVTAVPPKMDASAAIAHWKAAGVSRIEVLTFAPLELMWLNATLARIAIGVSFRRDEPDVAVAWEWPLRIGLFDDDRSAELRTSLDSSSLRKLVRFVTVGPSATECELLLLPYNLRTSVQRVLGAHARISADCVIVLGGAKVEHDRLEPLLHTLRTDVRTAGVAIAAVPKERRAEWMHAVVAHLAHNTTLDEVLRIAGNESGADAPLLVCSRRLAELARLSHYVERFGSTLKRAVSPAVSAVLQAGKVLRFGVQTIEAAGDLLQHGAHTFQYNREIDEATAVVELREEVESAMSESLRVPRMANGGGTPRMEEMERAVPMASPAGTPPERFVRADFCNGRKASTRAPIIEPRHPYYARIRIAPKGGKGAVANVPVDESQLPPSANGHDLTIAFFELRDGGHEPSSPPAQRKIHLPANRGESSEDAWFPMITPARGSFVARVIVLHETRVLQTLLLRAPVGTSQDEVTLKQEALVRTTLEDPGPRRAFDAAIVVNDADGVPAVMAVTPKSVAYKEPVDIRAPIEAISKAVNELTKLPDTSDLTLDDDDVVAVLIQLANQGKLLHKWIAANLPGELASATHLQILEAREGSFLPLEFAYPSYAPEKTAKICPHGKAELAQPTGAKCPNERDRNFVCPAVFWGFSRVLERFPHPPQDAEPADYRLSTPMPNRTKIHPFESALVAASAKVRTEDVTGANGVVASITPLVTEVFTAKDWDAWSAEIGLHSPSMLLLFPHSEEVDDIAALEIGAEYLKLSFLEQEYVRRDDRDPGPLILLLGCSTTLPRVRFQSFVSEFRKLGASIVVGTLSLIRGRHATRFVKEFVSALSKRAGTQNGTRDGTQDAVFGDVLLDAKRSMLAAGDPFALTLIAYGDADWRL